MGALLDKTNKHIIFIDMGIQSSLSLIDFWRYLPFSFKYEICDIVCLLGPPVWSALIYNIFAHLLTFVLRSRGKNISLESCISSDLCCFVYKIEVCNTAGYMPYIEFASNNVDFVCVIVLKDDDNSQFHS